LFLQFVDLKQFQKLLELSSHLSSLAKSECILLSSSTILMSKQK
jgi:hypothetical protein